MYKLINLFFFFVLTSLSLAAQETETWSCHGTAAGGLFWQEGKWNTGEFGTRIYRIELQNFIAEISENNDPVLFLMDCHENTWSWSCTNDAASLELNKDNNSAVIMRFWVE